MLNMVEEGLPMPTWDIFDQNYTFLERENPDIFAEEIQMETERKAKKEKHKANERERRMKLTQTYSNLRSLLPNSRRSKKRWSSSIIIEKVLNYIPSVEKEIEKLNQKKEKLVKAMENNKSRPLQHSNRTADSFVIHQLGKEEVIIQICMQQIEGAKSRFSNLILNAEAQGMQIIGASAIAVSDGQTLSCHLHIKMNGSGNLQEAAGSESMLREKVVSWLI